MFAFFRGMVGEEIFENEMKGKIHKTYFQFFFPLEIKNKSLEILEIKKLVMFLWAQGLKPKKVTKEVDMQLKVDYIIKVGKKNIPIQVKTLGGLLRYH